MARGTIAKENVIKKIQEAFGDAYIGISDKKVYVWGNENGEKVQVCLTLSCPKAQVTANDKIDFETVETTSAEIPPKEKDGILQMMARLGL